MELLIERGGLMGWQADDDPGPGDAPGPGEGLPELLAAFEHGGAWDAAAPSAALAAALEAAAGPEGLYDGAGAAALVGITRQWAALESWAAAGHLGSLRAMMREDGEGPPLLRRRIDLPDGWGDSLNYEIAAALAMGPVSAGNLARLAWTLGMRLPGIGRLLADGTLTKAKAKLIAADLRAPRRGRGGPRRGPDPAATWRARPGFQVRAAGLAGRPRRRPRPRRAPPHRGREAGRARVTIFREESGAVGLSGRDLPAAAGPVRPRQRPGPRRGSTRRPARSPTTPAAALQALAYLHLLERRHRPGRHRVRPHRRPPEPPDDADHDEDDETTDEDPDDEDPCGEDRDDARTDRAQASEPWQRHGGRSTALATTMRDPATSDERRPGPSGEAPAAATDPATARTQAIGDDPGDGGIQAAVPAAARRRRRRRRSRAEPGAARCCPR